MRLTHTNDSLKLTEYAERHAGQWHTHGTDKRTLKAVERALILGRIETNEFKQFRHKSTP